MKVENFKQFSLKMLRCEARVFPVGTVRLHDKSAIFFYSAENAHVVSSPDPTLAGRRARVGHETNAHAYESGHGIYTA